ncbi:hypothetical protein FKW77_007882 [Venturia effusa]|uniref:Uncharacterized protein n=1 Tax=Venturia effusa TaxID=50376 RepID=A0A517LBA2_9PEZI|nr:hypothetical protein FKW77_007882 [Venturia effusa]
MAKPSTSESWEEVGEEDQGHSSSEWEDNHEDSQDAEATGREVSQRIEDYELLVEENHSHSSSERENSHDAEAIDRKVSQWIEDAELLVEGNHGHPNSEVGDELRRRWSTQADNLSQRRDSHDIQVMDRKREDSLDVKAEDQKFPHTDEHWEVVASSWKARSRPWISENMKKKWRQATQDVTLKEPRWIHAYRCWAAFALDQNPWTWNKQTSSWELMTAEYGKPLREQMSDEEREQEDKELGDWLKMELEDAEQGMKAKWLFLTSGETGNAWYLLRGPVAKTGMEAGSDGA